MENCDLYVLNRRSDLYQRTNAFVEMSKKHKLGDCNCSKGNKKCNCSGIIDLDKLDQEDYVTKLLESGQLEAIYNIVLSVTNSLKNKAGTDFEKCIEDVFSKNNIEFSKQVYITSDGLIVKNKPRKGKSHSVDLMIPPPKFNTKISDYSGDILSVKTTVRERYLQDKYLSEYKCRLVLISLESVIDNKIISIKVDKDEKNLHNYILSLKNR